MEFDRSKHPSIRRALKGLRIERPSEHRHKRPIAREIMELFHDHTLRDNSFTSHLFRAVFSIAFFSLLRPTELSHGDTHHAILNRMLQFTLGKPPSNEIVEVVITISSDKAESKVSKANQTGARFEQTAAKCNCADSLRIWCPVHTLLQYLCLRTKRFGRRGPKEPVFWNRLGRPLQYDAYRKQLNRLIDTVNRRSRFTLDPKYYTPHCFRSGGCTEMARQRLPASVIKKLGRWKSETWNQFYFSLNFIDVSIISGTPICDLLSAFRMVDF